MPIATAAPAASTRTPAAARVGAEPEVTTLWWWSLLGIGAVALALVLRLFSHRRGGRSAPADAVPLAPAAAPPTPVPTPAPPRARLMLDLVPVRGGLTLISMAFEGELVVRNDGPVPAGDVRVETTLLPARSEQDAELGALFARPIARPAAPPFALAPGEERRVRVVAALPLAGVEPLVAGGRRLLVPVLAANVTYATRRDADADAGEGEGEGQSAASWIIGVARAGSAKLAPFWVDAPRMHDALAARPHALAVTR